MHHFRVSTKIRPHLEFKTQSKKTSLCFFYLLKQIYLHAPIIKDTPELEDFFSHTYMGSDKD